MGVFRRIVGSMGACALVVSIALGAAGAEGPPGETRNPAGAVDLPDRHSAMAGRATWGRNFGGTASDFFRSVDEISDGGYIVAGDESSWGAGSWDGWVMKLDSSGAKVWSSTFGGSASDAFCSVWETTDGGYVVAGQEDSWGRGGDDGWVMKLDSDGNKVWSSSFGGGSDDRLQSVCQINGDFLVAGYEKSWGRGSWDGWVIKLDSGGNRVWSRTFGGTSGDYLLSIHPTADGGSVAAGYQGSWGNGSWDGWVIKLDSDGNKVWSKTFGGVSDDYFTAVQQTADGGYVVAGYERSWGNGNWDAWVMKLDSSGTKVWARTFGGSQYDRFDAVRQTADGKYVVAGGEDSWGSGSWDGWVMRLDSAGEKLWSRTFGGSDDGGGSDDAFWSVRATADTGYIVAGHESSWGNGGYDGWAVKLDSNGNR